MSLRRDFYIFRDLGHGFCDSEVRIFETGSKIDLASPVSEAVMAFVIAEPCVGVKDTACVDVCPCDCIHPRKDEPGFVTAAQLYIDPDDCIDCGACVPACPVSAIFHADDL